MKWEAANELLLQKINIGNHIDPNSQYRYVLIMPNEHIDFFRISIGATSNIKLTLEMLENIFNATIANNGIYNRAVIHALYPQKVNNKGCHVHVVGWLFVSADVMINDGNNFLISPI